MHDMSSTPIFEIDHTQGKLQLRFLANDCTWLPLYAVELFNQRIQLLYRLPLLLKLTYAGHRSQSNVTEP